MLYILSRYLPWVYGPFMVYRESLLALHGGRQSLIGDQVALSPSLDYKVRPVGICTAYLSHSTAPLRQKCAPNTIASSILMITAIAIAEAIMFIRVYALSQHDKRLGIWLAIQFLVSNPCIGSH